MHTFVLSLQVSHVIYTCVCLYIINSYSTKRNRIKRGKFILFFNYVKMCKVC